MNLKEFSVKLACLIMKISVCSRKEIQQHTWSCHLMVAQLIKDDEDLKVMSSCQLRLLAYESILFLAQIIGGKNQESSSESMAKNKIQFLLKDIYRVMSDIEAILTQIKTDLNPEAKCVSKPKYCQQNRDLTNFYSNIIDYQNSLASIFLDYQKFVLTQKQIPQTTKNQLENNHGLLEQMHRLIQKKEKTILELTKVIALKQNQKLSIELAGQKILHEMSCKNDQFAKQIQFLVTKNQGLSKLYEQQKQNTGMLIINAKKSRLKVNSSMITWNERFQQVKLKPQSQGNDSAKESPTKQIVNSIQKVKISAYADEQTFSLMNNLNIRARQTCYNKDLTLNQKNPAKSMSEQLYMMILCQAAWIESFL